MIAETITIVTSTKSPNDIRSENIERKLKDMPVTCIVIKENKKEKGIAKDAINACLIPKNRSSTINTRPIVIEKFLNKLLNCSSNSSAVE